MGIETKHNELLCSCK